MANLGPRSLGGSSLPLHSAQSSFDMRDETDVIAVLKLIHTNPLESEIKNHLRDLIFAYRQDQTPDTLRKIHETFKPFGVEIVLQEGMATRPQHSQQSKSSVGMARPLPSFAAPKIQEKPKPKDTFTVPIKKEVQEVKKTPEPASEVKSTPVKFQDKPLADEPAQVTAKAESEKPRPAISTPPPNPSPVPVTPQEAEPVPAASSEGTAAPKQYTNVHDRIKEIKQIVNDKVGNPVNLIDANNEVGREYMNALLDAMKKSNGGSEQEISSAMARLEKAFVEVQSVILQAPKAPQAQPVPSPVQEVKREPVKPASPPVTSLKTETAPKPTPAATQNDVVPKVQSQSAPSQSDAANAKQASQGEMRSVAKEKQLQDLLRANRQKQMESMKEEEEKRIAAMDPLMTPEVTAGLSQLLSEWSLFKSSGIFGTGPSGKDHALYIKLAPLTMAAVIAGRFEGATNSIKQNIADYMNGWRYEEGIIHEHGETFEHYLRRVIYHILQKKKQSLGQ